MATEYIRPEIVGDPVMPGGGCGQPRKRITHVQLTAVKPQNKK